MRYKTCLLPLILTMLGACSQEPDLGEQTYLSICVNCHANGLNGAPIPGKPKMWAPRLEQGIPTLVEHAIHGYELMPAKGGKTELSDEAVEAAVNYMVSYQPQ